ncbi:nitroreductase [Bdellovibrio sp. KM01]|uniref:nitroreductase n=1 Tax=Bdellovibrio sp. KM01 TaxID=2748865 RepID=UPI0015EAD198|nr:nitroreductase [Bdellovibrio sp. KM01]QLY23953.1 nitroreductase [Bdellovibrio sp. KM01]
MAENIPNQQFTENAEKLIRSRRSKRDYLPGRIPQETLCKIFELANQAPSSTNTQARRIEVVSGPLLQKLSTALKSAYDKKHTYLDFPYTSGTYTEVYSKRMQEFGAGLYGLLKIARGDQEGNRKNYIRNLEFFGAPHAAFLFVPNFDVERNLNDIGMYGQTLLLAMKAYGIDSCPQAVLGMYCDVIRETLNISPEYKLLWGISFGYANPEAPVNQLITSRAPLNETVTFRE